MAYRIGIVGASGYGGAELLRLLAAHPALELATVAAQRHAGTPVSQLFPNLDTGPIFDEVEVGVLAGLDLVFLAVPHGAAMELGGTLHQAGTRVVDLSAAFRLPASEFADWYGESHLHPRLTPARGQQPGRTGSEQPGPTPDGQDSAAVYGLTEWQRETVRDATLVANPGCYPTAALLALLPLAGLVEPGSIVVDAKSGTSGAGRGIREDLHHSHADGDVVAYGAPRHRHTGEIERWLAHLGGAATGAVSFTPHLVPMARGLLATCYAQLAEGITGGDVADAFERRYANEPFVRLLPAGSFPHTKALTGSNGCQLAAVVDERTRRVVLTSAIDNLGKGAAGQALQNANLMLGLDETVGLTSIGVYP